MNNNKGAYCIFMNSYWETNMVMGFKAKLWESGGEALLSYGCDNPIGL